MREKDRGWAAIEKRLQKAGKSYVKVGVMAGAHVPVRPGQKPIPLPDLATIHEFGAPDANIPERSFIRAGIDEKKGELDAMLAKLHPRVIIDGTMDERTALELIGLKAQAIIQAKIVDGPFAPNAPSTIAAKGSSVPLIDSGQMRAAVTYLVVDANPKEEGGE